MKIQFTSVIFLLFSINISTAQINFQKIFGGTGYDLFNNAALTSDSGYILVGLTDSMGTGIDDVYVVRTNSAGDTLWTGAYGGPEIESARTVIETSVGDFIIAGTTKINSFSKSDIYIIKINANGDLIWSKSYGTGESDWGTSILETSDSGFIVTGRTENNQLIPDILLMRLNSQGDTVWTKTYNGPDWDIGNSVLESSDGGFIVAGYTENFGLGSSDVLLMKTDNVGTIQWAHAYGNIFHNYGWMVQHSPDGGFVIAGSSADSTGYYNYTFLKTDASGNPVISKVYKGPGDDNQVRSIVQNSDGSYTLGGTTFDFATVDQDVYLIRIDSLGDPLWAKTYGTNNTQDAEALLPATGNGYMICGRKLLNGFGFYDGYMIRTDSLGNSGCLDSISALPTLLAPLFHMQTSFLELPFAPSVNNHPAVRRRGTSYQNLCIVDGITVPAEINFSVYPNPANSKFTVRFEKMIENGWIEISNMLGSVILNSPVKSELQKEVSVENISSGIYFLTVSNDGIQHVKKIIVD